MENSLPKYITLTEDNIDKEHICCAFSDKKCLEGYESKKEWLKKEFANGYVFRRLDARAKVFIEYVPAEYAWLPVTAPNYLMINCFWVSGQYKGQGHGYNLLQFVIEDAKKQQKNGLVTVVGTKKNHFMSDTKWLLQHGFKEIEKLPSRDKEIMKLRYGLFGSKEITQKELAEKLNISQSYISRIEKKVIKKIKETIKI